MADSARDVNPPPSRSLTRAALAATLLALPLAGGGCQSVRLAEAYTPADDFKAFIGVAHAEPADTRYRVAAPDTLTITVLRSGEAVDHRVTLPPDGRLLLPGLAWPVDTTGLTPGEIAEDLRRALTAATQANAGDAGEDTTEADSTPATPAGPMANRGLTLDPAEVAEAERARLGGADPVYVAVRVDRFASRRVFVFGQVDDPGAQAWDGTNRLSSVLAAAGPGHRADLSRVLVLRPGPDGDPQRRLVVAARRLLDTGDNTRDVALAPDDIVFVPATGLGRVGLALDQVRPSPRAGAAWWGTRPGPFFPPVARVALIAPAAALAADTAANATDPPHVSVAEVDTPPVVPTDQAVPDTPAPAAEATGARAELLAADAGVAVADPFADPVAATAADDPSLMQIRFGPSTAPHTAPPAPANPAAEAEARADADTVHFWAP